MILTPNKKYRKIFFLACPRHCDWGLIVVIVYYFSGGARGIMVIVVGNGHGDTSSGRD